VKDEGGMSASKVRVHELLGPLSVNKKTLYSWYDMVGDMLLRIRLKKKKKLANRGVASNKKKQKQKRGADNEYVFCQRGNI